jgi:hypothetical protein
VTKRSDTGCGWGFALYGAILVAVLFIWGWEVPALMLGAFFVLGIICVLIIVFAIRNASKRDAAPPTVRPARARKEERE